MVLTLALKIRYSGLMANQHQQADIAERVVSAMATARRRESQLLAESDSRIASQLLHAMALVRAARFCAAARLERKHALSMFVMPIVSLYFVGLSVWQVVYASRIDEGTHQLISLVSIMSSICTLVLSIMESTQDYKLKSRDIGANALAINDLFHEFRVMKVCDPMVVQDFRRRYNEVVRSCPLNHARVDYLMARAELLRAPRLERASASLQNAFNTYALYAFCVIAPPLVLLLWK